MNQLLVSIFYHKRRISAVKKSSHSIPYGNSSNFATKCNDGNNGNSLLGHKLNRKFFIADSNSIFVHGFKFTFKNSQWMGRAKKRIWN